MVVAASGRSPGHTGAMSEPQVCQSCGRAIEKSATGEPEGGSARFCSSACRKRGVTDVDRQLESAITELLAQRAATATICPSDAARLVAGTGTDGTAWRHLMEPARRAARRLVDRGEVEITQGGSVVDPSTTKGPIRIRRR